MDDLHFGHPSDDLFYDEGKWVRGRLLDRPETTRIFCMLTMGSTFDFPCPQGNAISPWDRRMSRLLEQHKVAEATGCLDSWEALAWES